MEKIIFFGLAIPILAFVLYLGVTEIMKGFSAKEANRSQKKEKNENINLSTENNKLSDELNKLNELHQSGAWPKKNLKKQKINC